MAKRRPRRLCRSILAHLVRKHARTHARAHVNIHAHACTRACVRARVRARACGVSADRHGSYSRTHDSYACAIATRARVCAHTHAERELRTCGNAEAYERHAEHHGIPVVHMPSTSAYYSASTPRGLLQSGRYACLYMCLSRPCACTFHFSLRMTLRISAQLTKSSSHECRSSGSGGPNEKLKSSTAANAIHTR